MSDLTNEFCVILSTAASEEEARAIARILVEHRLAGCVQVSGPIESHYRWDGEIQVDLEYRIIVKTRVVLLTQVQSLIKKHHSYDEPQIVVLPIVDGSVGYLTWLNEQTSPEM